MSDHQEGPGWWLASDGRWYPPDQAPAVPPPATWSTPPPGPPPRQGLSGGAIAALVAAGVVGLLVLVGVAVAFLGTESSSSSFSSVGEVIGGSEDDDDGDDGPTDPGDAAVPEGFEVLEGDGVSVATPEGWSLLDAEDVGMSADDFAAAYPDAPTGMVEQAAGAFDQGAVLIAFDFEGTTFADNITVLEVPTEASVAEIEGVAADQIEVIGGEVRSSERVDTPLGPAVRLRYSLEVTQPGGSTIVAEGVQHYVPYDGRTFIVTVSTGTRDEDLADRIMATFRVG